MNAPHPSDPGRTLRYLRSSLPALALVIGLATAVVGMLICLFQLSGWIGSEGLRW